MTVLFPVSLFLFFFFLFFLLLMLSFVTVSEYKFEFFFVLPCSHMIVVCFCFFVFAQMLNPIIYVTFHQDFRRAFKHLLCFQCSSLGSRLRAEAYRSQYGGSHGQLSRVEMARSKKYVHRPTSSLPEGVSAAPSFSPVAYQGSLHGQQNENGPRVQFQPDTTSISGAEVAPFLSSPGVAVDRDCFITTPNSTSGFVLPLGNTSVNTAGSPSVAHSTRLTNTATTTMATGCAN